MCVSPARRHDGRWPSAPAPHAADMLIAAAALLGGWAGLRLYLHIRAAQRRAAGCAHDGLAAGRWLHQQGGRAS